MKTPDDKTIALPCCQVDEIACHDCKYFGKPFCANVALKDALEKIKTLEEQIDLMKIQMRGDCGVCKYRNDARCHMCLEKGDRALWEYEGLPELPKKGASK